MKKLLLLLTALMSIQVSIAQQHKCATMPMLEKRMQANPELRKRIQRSEANLLYNTQTIASNNAAVITIPVVVHVVWNQASQNVSDAQILSQINVLNKDFRLLNSDSLKPSNPFWGFTSDTEIDFCLATKDPNGNATTGITRTQTNITEWNDNNSDNLKNSALGGKDNWDPTRYLNLYVANLQDGVLGFATFPDDLSVSPNLDGVVIRPEAFGTVGTAGNGIYGANDKGRTATHEVGHWLFLRHIWGDEPCGNDFVNDTPIAEAENYNCPTFPANANNSCGTGANGEMYMNYMDYVDDACMNMFTNGQKVRMRNTIAQLRPGLLNNTICSNSVGINQTESNNEFTIYPNPSNDVFYVDFGFNIPSKIIVYNSLGIKVFEIENNTQSKIEMNAEHKLAKGLYIVDAIVSGVSVKEKLIIK